MNLQSKPLIAAALTLVLGVAPGLSAADSAEEIRARVGAVGKLNIASGEAAAQPAAAPEATSSSDAAPAASTMTATSTAATTTDAAAAGDSDPAALYQAVCFACHGTGAAGSPIVGDTAVWAPRIAQGMDVLVNHALNGINAMPPRGASTYSDDEIRAIVAYMVENSQ